MVEIFSADVLAAIKSHWAELHLELFLLLQLNNGGQGEHLTSLLLCLAAWLLVTHVWPVYLVDESVLGAL